MKAKLAVLAIVMACLFASCGSSQTETYHVDTTVVNDTLTLDSLAIQDSIAGFSVKNEN